MALMKPAVIPEFFARLKKAIPEPETELEYDSVYQLLVAVVLSAQATDIGVNRATEPLFKIVKTPQQMLKLGEKKAVRFAKVMTCLNIGCPLGMGIWEGVPLREVLWLTQPRENLRRAHPHAACRVDDVGRHIADADGNVANQDQKRERDHGDDRIRAPEPDHRYQQRQERKRGNRVQKARECQRRRVDALVPRRNDADGE